MVFTRALAAAAAGPETPDTPALREPAEHPAAPFVPTPRMRFVKWLVETGRLSDQ